MATKVQMEKNVANQAKQISELTAEIVGKVAAANETADPATEMDRTHDVKNR